MMHTKTEPFISTDSLTDAALADGSFSASPSDTPLRRESEGSEKIDQPEMLGEDTPLVSLQKDVVNLNNCLDGYIQHLSDGLAACEPTGSASRMLLSRTSLALFGLVAALTIALNATLLSMSAGSGQMLQANCALGVLHVLVSICVLHDLSKNRSQQSSECQVLELRTEDVVEQFKELTKTRQEWVADLTRSQWIAETEKLKLQLVQQD
ncbi:MAG: hypothetical protein IT423_18470, partial [Pirellulaceae bacterium]|nr:hypothetical protein [Pirellulaceae bacterium]